MQLLSIGWIDNKVKPYITGNFLQHSAETYIGKESEKGSMLYVYIKIIQFAELLKLI